MASGSTAGHGGKGFDFGSDDILCSYEDYGNHQPIQDSSNGSFNHSNPSKDFQNNRISRASVIHSSSYGLPEDSISHEVIVVVERTMKKHTENMMRFLEGISSRLSQLELYCYNLDKSISEMKSDILRDHGEADNKLTSLEKHLQEVHRSVQILRDKQELADTQKELAKLQLAQKESSSSSKEDKSKPSSEVKKTDQHTEAPPPSQQLPLALPNQVAPQHQPSAQPPPPQTQPMPSPQPYYTPPQQPQPHYLPAVQSSVSQAPPGHQFPQYQQQWPQQLPQQVAPLLQASALPQVRPPSTTVYSPYLPPGQSPVPPPESHPIHGDASSYGYGTGRPILPQIKNPYTPQQADGYNVGAYVIYDEAARRHQQQPSSFPHPVYGTTSLPLQKPQSGSSNRNNPYNDLIEKMVNMGFRADHVISVIQSLEENGQAVDFHAVLDRLNLHSSGGSQRGWSG